MIPVSDQPSSKSFNRSDTNKAAVLFLEKPKTEVLTSFQEERTSINLNHTAEEAIKEYESSKQIPVAPSSTFSGLRKLGRLYKKSTTANFQKLASAGVY